MTKQRIHNEWFQPIVKKNCPCGKKKIQTFAWGEYVNGRWRTIEHFCQDCFMERIVPQLQRHAKDCGCGFSFNARAGYTIPSWICLPISYHGSCKSLDPNESGCTSL